MRPPYADTHGGNEPGQGFVPFSAFMREALYGPEGYYARSVRIGADGDFVTAAASPLFAGVLARYIGKVWHRFGRPRRLQLVELGAGEGTLAEGLLRALADHLADGPEVIVYVIIEASDVLRTRQEARLRPRPSPATGRPWIQVHWADPDPSLDTVLLANEVLDALPVERVRRTADGWERMWVRWERGMPVEIAWRPAPPDLAERADVWLDIPPGTEAELCLEYEPLMLRCTRFGRRMAALWFDYGITRDEWQAGIRPRGTLRAYQRHAWVDWRREAGRCDITADVHWDLAMWAAEQAGWQVRLWQQGEFLLAHGILDFVQPLADDGSEWRPALARYRQTAALKQLILPGGMGERFSCLECWRADG
ncbi:SAM-dependent methyltransferase [Alicyclobacillus cellulosilyticus]|uniref:SAM-dependent methyltransferase n=1 Tax=Alicyclobacillus cellulosilyticus TaxID=1003997 RepID=A0A917K218_9BACL|nr:SAM-dependent methyltransferase [Alicyclobacillus cellulosilyticus]GGI97009.1 SAM-dependent methyltransferase [Alicyclobacillus cellulosilyticus]